ncbi:LLM class flavin-dependent oxidoreductase [Falsiroseomonas oryzae]|uniref:LLM class flavin-dependent oxidoreductase n=1 Tax=Falsiroseomonas oryzae TaxID=2766473 RepID=UPI0022EA5924|nr:LLM class flavin-dependent oxidoreductase [Roseomonas sp. MO-31]
MQFSFSLVPTMGLRDYARVVQRAEAWGFDHVWCPDQGFMRDPFVALAAAATGTSIPLGLAVTNPFSRHPVQVARAAGTLADLRNGQFILGYGAGELERQRRRMGAPEGPLIAALRDAVTTCRRLLAGERVSIESPVFQLRDVGLEFTPTAPVPIYIATAGPQAFALSGELADGVIVGDVACPKAMREIVRLVREAAERAGRPPGAVKVVAWVSTIVTDEPAALREMLRLPVIGRAASNMAGWTRGLLGVDDHAVAALKAALASPAGGIGQDIVPDSLIDAMALVGTASDLVARIAALGEAGVDMIGCRMPVALASRVDFEGNLARIAEQVIPAFRNGERR